MGAPAVDPNHLTWTHVALTFSFTLLSALLSAIFNLGIGGSLITAALRCTIQLASVGVVLQHVFEANNLYQVMGIAFLLNLLGTIEAVTNKSKQRFRFMFFCVLLSMLGSIIPVATVGLLYALEVHPFWSPKQFIPVVGSLCGHTVASAVVAVAYVLQQIYDDPDKLEIYLAFGGSRFEACTSIAREGLRLALTPTINQMSIMGIIFIPGTMTGAILGGSSVAHAAKLQMVMMFMISASNSLACIVITILTLAILVDGEHRIRPDRVDAREHPIWRARTWLVSKIVDALKALGQTIVCCGKGKNDYGERQRLLGTS